MGGVGVGVEESINEETDENFWGSPLGEGTEEGVKNIPKSSVPSPMVMTSL